MKTLLLILLSASCEALWNICLAKSKGWNDWCVNLIGALLLLAGIITFKKALDSMPLSVVIIIWSGLSLSLTILLDMYIFKTKINYMLAFFMILGVISILGMNYFSTAK